MHCFLQNAEADAAWLKTSTPDARAARRVVIAATFPELIAIHEHKCALISMI